MPIRSLPVVPDLDQLKHQAKDLLRALHKGETNAVAELREFHPDNIDPTLAKLADAQHVLARSYQASSWTRLVQAVQLVDAIWKDDIDVVRELATRNPNLLHEMTLIRKDSNWGPPMSYAANVGRDRIIQLLHSMGATDLSYALERAALQGKIGTAKMLHAMMGSPLPPPGALGGPAYTLNSAGTRMLLEAGAPVKTPNGDRLAPVDVVLETDSRKPTEKHAILEMYEEFGFALPDTPTMALHRGRIDLLEEQLRRDPAMLTRRLTHKEIYPSEMGCRDEVDATVGTPLGGTTLLHMCVDYDEMEIARWLLEKGADVNTPSMIGANGFGGYTALFNTVVSQPNFWMNYQNRGASSAPFAELLLSHRANPNVRASVWKRLHPGHGDSTRHEYRDVTPLGWGQQFHARVFVSARAMQLITDAGGTE
ncbi:MAG: ankyrin repeat domain-containing protein [Gemmatimonadaceae bacterium]